MQAVAAAQSEFPVAQQLHSEQSCFVRAAQSQSEKRSHSCTSAVQVSQSAGRSSTVRDARSSRRGPVAEVRAAAGASSRAAAPAGVLVMRLPWLSPCRRVGGGADW